MNYLESFTDMLRLRGLTEKSIKSYTTYIKAYLDFIEVNHLSSPDQLSWEDMRRFITQIQEERQLSDRTVNAIISQLRFFTIFVIHKTWDPTQIPRRKFDTYLPYVPSQEDAITFIDSIPDLKPRAMISLLFSAGLRADEVCHLKAGDIERSRHRIHIRQSKNRSDRYAQLSDKELELLIQYWYQCGKPGDWLFPAAKDPSRPCKTQFIGYHIKKHKEELGWSDRPLTAHSFRHCYGTCLYESGADLLTIQAYMGHRSLRSTLIYIHLSSRHLRKFKSPYDLGR